MISLSLEPSGYPSLTSLARSAVVTSIHLERFEPCRGRKSFFSMGLLSFSPRPSECEADTGLHHEKPR
jgi:hypothetical protein